MDHNAEKGLRRETQNCLENRTLIILALKEIFIYVLISIFTTKGISQVPQRPDLDSVRTLLNGVWQSVDDSSWSFLISKDTMINNLYDKDSATENIVSTFKISYSACSVFDIDEPQIKNAVFLINLDGGCAWVKYLSGGKLILLYDTGRVGNFKRKHKYIHP